MHTISSVLNEYLIHVSVLNPASPLTERDVIGRTALEFCPPDQRKHVYDRLKRCLETGEPQSYRVRIELPERGEQLFLIRAARFPAMPLLLCRAIEVPLKLTELSERDLRLLMLAARLSPKEIAHKIHIKRQTILRRWQRLQDILELKTRDDLLMLGDRLNDWF